jgi:uncharacterized protein (DUF3084 family)
LQLAAGSSTAVPIRSTNMKNEIIKLLSRARVVASQFRANENNIFSKTSSEDSTAEKLRTVFDCLRIHDNKHYDKQRDVHCLDEYTPVVKKHGFHVAGTIKRRTGTLWLVPVLS